MDIKSFKEYLEESQDEISRRANELSRIIRGGTPTTRTLRINGRTVDFTVPVKPPKRRPGNNPDNPGKNKPSKKGGRQG